MVMANGASRTSRVASACTLAFCAILALGPTAGTPARALEIVADPPLASVSVTTRVNEGRVALRLRNPPTGAAVRLTPDANFRHAASNRTSPAAWSQDGQPAAPDSAASFPIGPGQVSTLEARGDVPEKGEWTTGLDVLAENGARIERFVLTVRREFAGVPSDFLLEPRPVVLPASLDPFGAAPRLIPLMGHNATGDPLWVSGASVLRVSVVRGNDLWGAGATALPSVTAHGCSGMVPAAASCTDTLEFPAAYGAGTYKVDVAVAGPGGGQSLRSVEVNVRAPGWLAGLVVAAGAFLGSAVDHWRSRGRRIIDARIVIAECSERAHALGRVVALPPFKGAIAELVRQLRDLDRKTRLDTAGTVDLTTHDLRLQALGAAAAALAAAARVPATGPAAPVIAERRAELLKRVQSLAVGDPFPDTAASHAMAVAATDLQTAVDQIGPLADAARKAERRLAEVSPALRSLFPGADLADDWEGLAEARRLVIPNPAVADLDAITQALIGATAKLEQSLDRVLAAFPSLVLPKAARLAEPDARKAAIREAEELARRWPGLTPDTRLMEATHYAASLPLPLTTEAAAAAAAAAPEAVVPAVPPLVDASTKLTLDLSGLLQGPGVGAPLSDLLRFQHKLDWMTNLLVLAVIAGLGVLVLWADRPDWGSMVDVVQALIAGVGTRVTIGLVSQKA